MNKFHTAYCKEQHLKNISPWPSSIELISMHKFSTACKEHLWQNLELPSLIVSKEIVDTRWERTLSLWLRWAKSSLCNMLTSKGLPAFSFRSLTNYHRKSTWSSYCIHQGIIWQTINVRSSSNQIWNSKIVFKSCTVKPLHGDQNGENQKVEFSEVGGLCSWNQYVWQIKFEL